MKPIVAIDPGTDHGAVAVWMDGRPDGCREYPNEALLDYLRSLSPYCLVVCERLECFGMPVGREVFETAYWIGRAMELCRSREAEFRLVSRRDVKMHFCGTMRAKDGNVAQALRDRFGEKGTKKNPGMLYGVSGHCWQALAIAVYTADTIEANPTRRE